MSYCTSAVPRTQGGAGDGAQARERTITWKKKIYTRTGNKAFPVLFLYFDPSLSFLTGSVGGEILTCLLAHSFMLVLKSVSFVTVKFL